MRTGPILLTLAAALLAACQLAAPGGSGTPGKGLTTEEISVTSLDAPPSAAEIAPGAEPDAEPGAEEAVAAEDAAEAVPSEQDPAAQPDAAPDETSETEAEAEEVPATPKSPEQLSCEAARGLWTPAGKTGAYLCLSPTGDAGKTCRKKQDCEGQCLARSNSCAPFTPLFGCNDILDKDGRRMTLCID